jgi:hypothetical protein
MTVQDVLNRIHLIKGVTDDVWLDKVADILIEIGNESLDKSKPTGQFVGYRGVSILEEWSVKDGHSPFHKKDLITNQWNPDPRVILIGKLINEIGEVSQEGFAYMQEAYYDVMKKYHGSIRLLEYAWKGIGQWQS